MEYRRALRSAARVVMDRKAPAVLRAEVAVDGAPVQGGAPAPVTVVQCADGHGLFCTRVQATLSEIRSRYGERVRRVHKDSPSDQRHPQARQAHTAARYAEEQGTCWASHDVLSTNAPKTSPEQLQASAQEVGLDLPACAPCVSSGTYQTAVPQDVEEGTRAGVTGHPGFLHQRPAALGRPAAGQLHPYD